MLIIKTYIIENTNKGNKNEYLLTEILIWNVLIIKYAASDNVLAQNILEKFNNNSLLKKLPVVFINSIVITIPYIVDKIVVEIATKKQP